VSRLVPALFIPQPNGSESASPGNCRSYWWTPRLGLGLSFTFYRPSSGRAYCHAEIDSAVNQKEFLKGDRPRKEGEQWRVLQAFAKTRTPPGVLEPSGGLWNPPVRSRNNLRSGNAWAAQMFLAARQETIIPKRESRPGVWGDPPRPPASCGFPLEPPSRSEVEYQGASAIPRELIEPHRGDKRHVTSQKRKVVRSAKQCQPPLSADRRSKAKTIVEGRGGIAGISFQVSQGTW
jgi:hypothetical protein